MKAANTKQRDRSQTKLLVASLTRVQHAAFSELPSFLRAGDLLVVNDAATLPASFRGFHRASGGAIEMRLARSLSVDTPLRWEALFFGAGDWRTPTEKRDPPPKLGVGDRLDFRYGLSARVNRLSHTRWAEIEFVVPENEFWRLAYLAGKPIQYSHLKEDLELWDVQTLFAGPAVSVEPPSAALPLSWQILNRLKERGVGVVALTHAAGLSSTGDGELDGRLPLEERYSIPESTAGAVNQALSRGSRVIALGTTVTRALESAFFEGRVKSGTATTQLRLEAVRKLNVVDGILTGFHDQGASHLELLGCAIAPGRLREIYAEADSHGYLAHEFGDACLLLTG